MTAYTSPIRLVPRWLHVWAILTVVATAPLLALGGLVTTRRVGMADPVWPTTPWFLFFASWTEPRPGFLIEHTHRLAGYIVGCLVIVLAIGMWKTARTKSLRWLGVACLVGVSAQGLLGGFRVALNALAGTDLAVIHGCFAQIVFCLLVGTAFATRAPSPHSELTTPERERCGRIAFLLTGLVFVQLIWGALVRHNPTGVVQRLHLLTAFLVVATAVWLIKTATESPPAWRRLRSGCLLLGLFLFLQVTLGVEAWMGKFASGVLPELQVLTAEQVKVRTAHVLVGAGILATSVCLVLLTRRPIKITEVESGPVPRLERPAEPALAGSHQLGGAS